MYNFTLIICLVLSKITYVWVQTLSKLHYLLILDEVLDLSFRLLTIT